MTARGQLGWREIRPAGAVTADVFPRFIQQEKLIKKNCSGNEEGAIAFPDVAPYNDLSYRLRSAQSP
ncbi:hypothetical protein ACGFJ7_45790 [Actinoplanes sp. NPDC048988]|uniref:hypothetical protein n=1 Tax=Actinoplanes sp. NPDC048988 TaxID=3363901 RepID=UPI003719BAFD